jgi:hypothetical protein
VTGYRRVDDEDDGPSADDLARFGHESGFCPHCGAEVWDDSQQCPSCGKWMDGPRIRRPHTQAARRTIGIALLGLALAAFLLLSLCSVG